LSFYEGSYVYQGILSAYLDILLFVLACEDFCLSIKLFLLFMSSYEGSLLINSTFLHVSPFLFMLVHVKHLIVQSFLLTDIEKNDLIDIR